MSLVRDAFSLTKVTPEEVLNKLLSGEYDELSLDDISFKLNLAFERKVEKLTISMNGKDFEERTISNGKKVCLAHLNVELYQEFIKNGVIETPKEYTCLWCRRKRVQEKPVRIPFLLVTDKKIGVTFVHVLYTTCSYNCGLAEIENRLERYPNDKNYQEAKLIFQLLFSRAYPGIKFSPAPDYLLLEENGGPVPEEIYTSSFYKFKEDKSYVFVPAQKLYFFSKSE